MHLVTGAGQTATAESHAIHESGVVMSSDSEQGNPGYLTGENMEKGAYDPLLVEADNKVGQTRYDGRGKSKPPMGPGEMLSYYNPCTVVRNAKDGEQLLILDRT